MLKAYVVCLGLEPGFRTKLPIPCDCEAHVKGVKHDHAFPAFFRCHELGGAEAVREGCVLQLQRRGLSRPA